MNSPNLYESFHLSTKPQTRVIEKNNFTYYLIINEINKFLDSPKKILDIGCGAGSLSLYFADRGHTVVGIDISKRAISICEVSRKYMGFSNAIFKVMDFPKNFPKEKYDFVICSEVLEHLKDDNFALKRIFSVLKIGGLAFISVPSFNAPLYKLGLATDFDRRVGHLRRYTLEQLINKCRKNGFVIVETKKTEGILRNFLFLNPIAGKSIRFIRFFLVDIVSYIDELLVRLFGESNIFVVLKKPI